MAPGGSVAVRGTRPKSSHHRRSIRADAAVHGFESQLKVQDLTDCKSGTEVPPQGNCAVIEVVHYLHQRRRERCVETRQILEVYVRASTHINWRPEWMQKKNSDRATLLVCAMYFHWQNVEDMYPSYDPETGGEGQCAH